MTVKRRIRLGEVLVQHGAITDEQLQAALVAQRRTGRKLGRVLADLGFMSESSLHEFLSKHLQVPFVDLKQARVDQETVKLLPEPLARRYRAIVLMQDARGLLVGMADPSDLHAYDELQARLKQPLRLALVGEADLLKTLDAVYRQTDEIASLAEAVRDDLRANDVDIELLSAEETSPDAPVIKLLQTMFNDAVQARASDIHIEPGENKLRIRLRVDGVLQEQVIEGRRVASALVTRLKLMSGLDIAEKRLPQDGRFSVRVREAGVDVRLATMPTAYGESVVMRLLSQSTALLSLEKLGMPAATEARVRRLVDRTAGMVLVTGPTGSGKTTTLYAALNHINRPGVKVITVEDPVEYRLDRITQVQVLPKIGLDFARVLRTALRLDPDILLIGEMRDRETVEIGLRGAMTGHLVFSTLHTINAIASVNRLLDMGAPGYMIAAAVHGVIAQRLVRRVCTDCAQPATPTANQLAWLATCRPGLDAERPGFHGRRRLHLLQSDGLPRPRRRLRDSRNRPRIGRRGSARRSRGFRPRGALAGRVRAARAGRDRFRAQWSDFARRGHGGRQRARGARGDERAAANSRPTCRSRIPASIRCSSGRVRRCPISAIEAARDAATSSPVDSRPTTSTAVAARLMNLGITPLEIAPDRDAGRHGAANCCSGSAPAGPRPPTSCCSRGRCTRSPSRDCRCCAGCVGSHSRRTTSLLRDALHDVLQSLESGRDFATSLGRHPDIFPPLFVSMVRVGESTGTLDNCVPAPVRVPGPGPGRAGPGQEPRCATR